MAIYLLSGLSGAGKTTLGNELAKRGYKVVNTDEALGYYGNIETGEAVERPVAPDREWFKTNDWIWGGDKLNEIIRSMNGDAFLCGGSHNETQFYPLFTKRFLIHASDAALVKRLHARNDPHTGSELYMQRMFELNQDAYAYAAHTGAVVIETDVPVEQSLQQIFKAIAQ